MTHRTNLMRGRLSSKWSKFAMALLVLLSAGVVIFYVNSLSPSHSKGVTYSAVKSFATAYTVTRTYTSRQTVIINNLWRPTSYLAGGDNQTCAVSNGRVFCWGRNDLGGQLGNGGTTNSNNPVAVVTSGALSGKYVTQISAGYGHTCAVATGLAYCWGNNSWGQLGDTTVVNKSSPVAVYTSGDLSGKNVTQVSLGDYHSCAVADGKAYCWGANDLGQAGIGSTSSYPWPNAVSTAGVLSGKVVTQIVTADEQTCALASGQVYCWGYNATGQLGNGANNGTGGASSGTTTQTLPVAVSTSGVLSGKVVTQIAAGNGHTCALADGLVYCWGNNNLGQLGTGNTTSSNVPVAVSTSGALSGKTVTQLTAGWQHTCAVADGQAFCWGYNGYGGLGNGANNGTGGASSGTTSQSSPVAVSTSGVLSGKVITQMVAGDGHTCAISNGRVYCWGYNPSGQLGVGTNTDSQVPLRINDSYY